MHMYMLNNFFSSVFTKEGLHQIPTLEKRYQNELMENIHISTEIILKKLKMLKKKKKKKKKNKISWSRWNPSSHIKRNS